MRKFQFRDLFIKLLHRHCIQPNFVSKPCRRMPLVEICPNRTSITHNLKLVKVSETKSVLEDFWASRMSLKGVEYLMWTKYLTLQLTNLAPWVPNGGSPYISCVFWWETKIPGNSTFPKHCCSFWISTETSIIYMLNCLLGTDRLVRPRGVGGGFWKKV